MSSISNKETPSSSSSSSSSSSLSSSSSSRKTYKTKRIKYEKKLYYQNLHSKSIIVSTDRSLQVNNEQWFLSVQDLLNPNSSQLFKKAEKLFNKLPEFESGNEIVKNIIKKFSKNKYNSNSNSNSNSSSNNNNHNNSPFILLDTQKNPYKLLKDNGKTFSSDILILNNKKKTNYQEYQKLRQGKSQWLNKNLNLFDIFGIIEVKKPTLKSMKWITKNNIGQLFKYAFLIFEQQFMCKDTFFCFLTNGINVLEFKLTKKTTLKYSNNSLLKINRKFYEIKKWYNLNFFHYNNDNNNNNNNNKQEKEKEISKFLGKGSFGTVFELSRDLKSSKYSKKEKEIGSIVILKQPRVLKSLVYNSMNLFKRVINNEMNILKIFKENQISKNVPEHIMYNKDQMYLIMKPKCKRICNNNIFNLDFWKNFLIALKKIHKIGIIHRDLRISNIMINPDDTNQPIIIDWGCAWSTYNNNTNNFINNNENIIEATQFNFCTFYHGNIWKNSNKNGNSKNQNYFPEHDLEIIINNLIYFYLKNDEEFIDLFKYKIQKNYIFSETIIWKDVYKKIGSNVFIEESIKEENNNDNDEEENDDDDDYGDDDDY
ncbi:hypothetical protein M0812_28942 [Anaeramoeba flamelloides]|uniref:Protein kinase domain-containing protein n=1 Tax=Anaeramoeba flamelloides TaxID=1746091 RepID=A0AAV7YC62_9EUKA|nr:hypothetical protein M0812_28942 [Anaeramoeba flamelloides]